MARELRMEKSEMSFLCFHPILPHTHAQLTQKVVRCLCRSGVILLFLDVGSLVPAEAARNLAMECDGKDSAGKVQGGDAVLVVAVLVAPLP